MQILLKVAALLKKLRLILIFLLPSFLVWGSKSRFEKLTLFKIIGQIKAHCKWQENFKNHGSRNFGKFVGPNGPREVIALEDALFELRIEVSDDYIRELLANHGLDQFYGLLITAHVSAWLLKQEKDIFTRGSYAESEKIKLTKLVFFLNGLFKYCDNRPLLIWMTFQETVDLICDTKVPSWYKARFAEISPMSEKDAFNAMVAYIQQTRNKYMEQWVYFEKRTGILDTQISPRTIWFANMLTNKEDYFRPDGYPKDFGDSIRTNFIYQESQLDSEDLKALRA